MITFSYFTNELSESVKSISAERVKALLLKNGNNPDLLDESALGDADESNIGKYLKQGAVNVSTCLSAYGIGLLDADKNPLAAFEIIAANPNAVPAVAESIVFRVDMPSDFNSENVVAIDQFIDDAMVNYALYRLYKNKGHDFESFFDDYETARNNVLLYVNQRTGEATKKLRVI